jgi:hypothetical protein
LVAQSTWIAAAGGMTKQLLMLVANFAGKAAQDGGVSVNIEQHQLGFDG